jgi:hypothetical protein
MLVRPLFHLPSRRWLVLLAAVAITSCSKGDALNPVQGTILDNKGQPVDGAVVTFHPKGGGKNYTLVLPVGRTGADGTFTLRTGEKEGAAAGEYVVTLVCHEVVNPQAKGKISLAPPETKDRFGDAYANRNNSRLHAEVKAGPNQLSPFQLK